MYKVFTSNYHLLKRKTLQFRWLRLELLAFYLCLVGQITKYLLVAKRLVKKQCQIRFSNINFFLKNFRFFKEVIEIFKEFFIRVQNIQEIRIFKEIQIKPF